MTITDRQALRASADLARLAHACALDLTDAAALAAFTSAAIRHGLVEAGAGAEGAASCLVLASCLGGSDGLDVCRESACDLGVCAHDPMPSVDDDACPRLGRRRAPWRCAFMRSPSVYEESPACVSADKTIFARHVVANYSRSVPASLGLHADFIGLVTPLRGSIYCSPDRGQGDLIIQRIGFDQPALRDAIEGRSMLEGAFRWWRSTNLRGDAHEP